MVMQDETMLVTREISDANGERVELEQVSLKELLVRQLAEADRHQRDAEELRRKMHWLVVVMAQIADGRTLPCQVTVGVVNGNQTVTVQPMTPVLQAIVEEHARAWTEYTERRAQALPSN